MPRKLFCELGPRAYQVSLWKVCALRHLRNLRCHGIIAREHSEAALPCLVYAHKSLIRRRLGDVDMALQENKAVNLGLAAPKLDGILIRPGETFSFWALVGNTTARKGYLDGLTLSKGRAFPGVGGGLCQLSNLLHWMALHSPLEIAEHHHHDAYDLFPDFGRQVPFGCGTSIQYNNLDYRLTNNTEYVFQLRVWTDETHLCGELRADKPMPFRWHVKETESRFVRQGEDLYRENVILRRTIDPVTGNTCANEVMRRSHAKVLYDEKYITCQIMEG
ncbi:MAG: VanW family protein [Oscillospiraceae bacterium]|nr:VanW family protein [Oscillospiraceae bacterium]